MEPSSGEGEDTNVNGAAAACCIWWTGFTDWYCWEWRLEGGYEESQGSEG
jgi:hypothetical protein